jgi:hypothetical protein
MATGFFLTLFTVATKWKTKNTTPSKQFQNLIAKYQKQSQNQHNQNTKTVHDRSLCWLGTRASIKQNSGVKLVVWAQAFPLCVIDYPVCSHNTCPRGFYIIKVIFAEIWLKVALSIINHQIVVKKANMVSTSIPHCFLRYLANIMRITMR